MKEIYTTVARRATAEIVEKKSRFIANIKEVNNEEDAIAFLEEIRKEHSGARHNVYAYIIEENNVMRYSDAGEPSGTAGMPVLDLLKKEGLSNVAVVVTRYFGGILLGTGGLFHAYSKSAKAGVESAGIKDMIMCQSATLVCDYTFLGKVQALVANWENVISEEPFYADQVSLPLYLPVSDVEKICAEIIDKTNAQVRVVLGETSYRAKMR